MKLNSRIVLSVFVVSVCAAPLFAANDRASANGQIQFASGASTATLRFSAVEHTVSGDVSGQITFSGPVELTPGNFTDVTLTVDVNCVQIAANIGSMSGTVTSSSEPSLVGTQSLLSVQDNSQGNGKNAVPDLYTWVMTSAADCHSFPPPTQTVTDGHVHVKTSNTPFF